MPNENDNRPTILPKVGAILVPVPCFDQPAAAALLRPHFGAFKAEEIHRAVAF
jgi:hypothetical protein